MWHCITGLLTHYLWFAEVCVQLMMQQFVSILKDHLIVIRQTGMRLNCVHMPVCGDVENDVGC